MCSSLSPFPLYFPSQLRLLYHHKLKCSSANPIFVRPRNPIRPLYISASVVQKGLDFSWVSTDQNGPDDYSGWDVVISPIEPKKRKKGATLAIIGVGATLATLTGVIAYQLTLKKGFSLPYRTDEKVIEAETIVSDESKENAGVSQGTQKGVSDAVDDNVLIEPKKSITRLSQLSRIMVSVDSTQQEAFLMLQKLKIIEDDVQANELCTRREYARWLVHANSLLERSQRHRILSSAALSGCTVKAFDDVNVEDPDFVHIQCLAEAGIVPSRLLFGNFTLDLNDSDAQKGLYFFPDRFISRQDLISWKAKLEYGAMPGINEEISRKSVDLLDVRDISSEAIVDIAKDVQADEKCILRKVFGQIKRFQPRKPSTKAQAAVALTSGRMEELVRAELSRQKAENASRQTTMREIRSELLERGDIQQFWKVKMEEERKHGLEIEKAYLAIIHDLEQEKIVQENGLPELLKQRAALDCQKQLLSSLKEEVDQMSEFLVIERSKYLDEKSNLDAVLGDLQVKYEGLLDSRSILEAEIEALRILRSWIDDEARKSQARAKVLEEVGRRWKWERKS